MNIKHSIFRYAVRSLGTTIFTLVDKPSGWFHVVLNYLGSADGEGIRVYHDGQEIPSGGRIPFNEAEIPGQGTVAIGRDPILDDGQYGSVIVDELRLFNQTLSDATITVLRQPPSG